MANGPGVYIEELDLSDYIQAISGTIFAALGGATKGPVNEPTQIFSEEDLIQKFGTPQLGNYGYGLHSMIHYLRQGRRGIFLRVSDGTDAEASVEISDATAVPPAFGVSVGTFVAKSPGTWGNNLKLIVSEVDPDPNYPGSFVFNLEIQAPADNLNPPISWVTVERWVYLQPELRLSTNPNSTRYFETVVNRGISGELAASRYVEATANADLEPFEDTYTLGSAVSAGGITNCPFVLGADGVAALADADYIGTYVGQTATGLKAFANEEKIDFNILAVPGVSSAPVINEAISVCSTRMDASYFIDPPFGLDVQGVVDWHNGVGYGHAAFDSSFALLAWSWVKMDEPYSKQTIYMPPSGLVAARCAYTERVRGSHWAPAGLQRGGLSSALGLEMSPSPSQRSYMYTDGNCVNPLVEFEQQGIYLWGQKTTQRRATALQDFNVRWMLTVAYKAVRRALRALVFENNDETLWRQFSALLTPYFDRLKRDRGLYDFRIICDESTNPPETRDQKKLYGRVLLKPTRVAEEIWVPFIIMATGASFAEAT